MSFACWKNATARMLPESLPTEARHSIAYSMPAPLLSIYSITGQLYVTVAAGRFVF